MCCYAFQSYSLASIESTHPYLCQSAKSRWYTFPLGAQHSVKYKKSLLYDGQVTYDMQGAQITQGICRKIIIRYAFCFWHFYIICIFLSFLHWLIDNCEFIKHCELQALHSLFCEYFSMHVLFFRLQVNNTHLDKTRSLQVACRRVIVS